MRNDSRRPALAAFFGPQPAIARVYGAGRREMLSERARAHGFEWLALAPGQSLDTAFFRQGGPEMERLRGELERVEVIFSTWGMPALSAQQLDWMPRLRAVFYAAGSVQNFARPLLERNVTVVSAWAANAVPVAEMTLAQILLSNKAFWRNELDSRSPETRGRSSRGRGNFGAHVSILGAGMIGRLVIQLLRPFRLQVLVHDPFLSEEAARELKVERVSLEEAFARGDVVTNHVANRPETVGMLRREHFAAMKPDATFINTGRGATLIEDDLIEVLRQRPDLTALLDVTHPEPPRADSPLYQLENVRLTSHIAGSIGDEVLRMADYVMEEFESWASGRPLRYGVSLAMLETMA